MNWLRNIKTGSLVVIVSVIAGIGWVSVGGTPALITSMVAGGLIALKGTLGPADEE